MVPVAKLSSLVATAFVAVLFGIFLLEPGPVLAQVPDNAAETRVKAGIYVSPPFVMIDANGTETGMAIDLWEHLAERLNIQTDYTVYSTFRDLIDATAGGAVDIAITNLTITKDRAAVVDFTQPWFDAGLRIMVSEQPATGFNAILQGLSEAGYLRAYGWLIAIIVFASLTLTAFDRRFDPDFPRRWRDGIAESFFAVMSVATSGRTPARKNLFGWLGRIWSALWLVCGIGVLAYVTSSVTSVMTTLAITGAIDGPADLPGRQIGVFAGSVAEDFSRASGLNIRSFAGIEAAVRALNEGQIDAIVGDAPVLEYYAHVMPDLSLSVVGQIFEPDKYGFALSPESALTKPLTIELLGLKEDGVIDDLKTEYFGSDW